MTDYITIPRATVQQALEALLWADAQGENWQQVVKKAIKPIQEAAAQPEPVQEPFGYLWPTGSHPEFRFTQQKRDGADGMPLYTAPLQQQAEPVEPKCAAIIEVFDKDWRMEYLSLPVGKHKLYVQQYTYTAPPQRKPLTVKEINALPEAKGYWPIGMNDRILRLIRAAEAAHGIKEGT